MAPLSRVIMTGATGNTGALVLQMLRGARPELEVLALIRPTSTTARLTQLGAAWLACDLSRPESYLGAIRPGDVLLEAANLRLARQMLPHLVRAGVERAFCVTTTAVFSTHHSYSGLYREIEDELRASPAQVTLLRPSMIYGNERDHNMHRLLRVLWRAPAYPLFGSGRALMQPVHVEDLAQGITQAVLRDVHGEFNLAGPQALAYRDVITAASAALGRRVPTFTVPVWPVAALVGALERLPGFPLRREQVIRLQEDKVFDIDPARQHLRYAPRPFEDGIRDEVTVLRARGLL